MFSEIRILRELDRSLEEIKRSISLALHSSENIQRLITLQSALELHQFGPTVTFQEQSYQQESSEKSDPSSIQSYLDNFNPDLL